MKVKEIVQLEAKLLHSRIHRLKSFDNNGTTFYVKREDELSFGISGSKYRKYQSLVPYLLKRGCKKAILIGGAYSNNLLGLSQQLIEVGITPYLVMRKPGSDLIKGNYLLTKLFVPEEQITLVERSEWGKVDQIAKSLVNDEQTTVIPEGACMKEAFPGALSLPVDILCNEQENGLTFNHLFLDSGTGLQAIATLLGLSYYAHRRKVHILLLAGSQGEFEEKLEEFHSYFEELVGKKVDVLNYTLYHPEEGGSFGSTSRKVFESIKEVARSEGILTDPVYSAKLFIESRKIAERLSLKGNSLLVHSGGALSLAGFQRELVNLL